MARIRSIHPSLWTDEDFVSLSMPARLVYIGTWNEADDYGMLPRRPVKLKMRLAPMDSIDMEAILREIVESGLIVELERDGIPLLLIANFRKWQRPQRPSEPTHGIDHEIARLIALPLDDSRHPDRDESTSTPRALRESSTSPQRKSFAMEDGGGKKEEKEANASFLSATSADKPEIPSVPLDECRFALKAWNDFADEHGLPKAEKLTQTRRASLRARLRDVGSIDNFVGVMNRIRGSPHCLGENNRGWRANFDWLLQPSSFQKLKEGFYDGQGPRESTNGRDQQHDAFAAVRSRIGD